MGEEYLNIAKEFSKDVTELSWVRQSGERL